MLWDKVDHTLVGNLTETPELRFTGNGTPVCNLRIASNRRYANAAGQQVEDTTFLDVTCWRDLAENVAQSMRKGDRVIVVGDLRQRPWTDNHGQTRTNTFIAATDAAISCRWDVAHSTRQAQAGQQQTQQPITPADLGDPYQWLEDTDEQLPLPPQQQVNGTTQQPVSTPPAPTPDDDVPF